MKRFNQYSSESDSFLPLWISLILFVAVVVGAHVFTAVGCYQKWPDHSPEFSVFTGCTVLTPEGRIPSANFRVL